jgi:hypothetical protein
MSVERSPEYLAADAHDLPVSRFPRLLDHSARDLRAASRRAAHSERAGQVENCYG